ncbi:hypothetical protein EH223_17490 [candidate division KSB1 bacterium]|nr:hypothetical protein [candidate division KSB1 bacterium]RQW00770.1 MAG: hypothetical protein EH223_17490 [candidate division KSB1 bacterium]
MNQKSGAYIGAIIIIIGVLALLMNINILENFDNLFGGVLLLAGALVFFSLYHRNRAQWWPLLPGTVFAVLGVGVFLDTFIPFASDLLGAAFMYAIFAVFGFVFNRDRASWWAIIPAGVFFTLGTIVLVDSLDLLDSDLNGVVFFLGLGLTFFYLWSLRHEIKNLDWAIWPAGVLLALALFVYLNQVRWMREELIFPLLIILVGVIIIVLGTRKKK